MIGRCESCLISGAALMSTVLRVDGLEGADAALAEDHVVIAASRIYSAASSHSSIVAAIPRLSSTGFLSADLIQEVVVLHVARADLEDVGVFAHQRDIGGVITSVTTASPVSARAFASNSCLLLPGHETHTARWTACTPHREGC